jgi:hypothetical protein
MKHRSLGPYIALLLLVVLLAACSGPAESSSNGNAPQQANSNSTDKSAAPQSDNPAAPSNATPLAVQPIPSPPAKSAEAAAKPADKPPAGTSIASNARLPKLMAPEKKIDFGKQPKDKTLVRAISIRNGGQADLNIESVTPS